jgi:hypothetical protein
MLGNLGSVIGSVGGGLYTAGHRDLGRSNCRRGWRLTIIGLRWLLPRLAVKTRHRFDRRLHWRV